MPLLASFKMNLPLVICNDIHSCYFQALDKSQSESDNGLHSPLITFFPELSVELFCTKVFNSKLTFFSVRRRGRNFELGKRNRKVERGDWNQKIGKRDLVSRGCVCRKKTWPTGGLAISSICCNLTMILQKPHFSLIF